MAILFSQRSVIGKPSKVVTLLSVTYTGKLGKIPNWEFYMVLYGFCVEVDYFPNMEIIQVFQTWILSSYQCVFLLCQTWIPKFG